VAVDVAVAVLLVLGVGIQVIACLGVLAMRGPYDRLHFAGAASLGAPFIALAILSREGFSIIANKALLVALLLSVTSPVLVHVTSRAVRIRERGDWEIEPEDRVEIETG
jgi:monovalent cation/proton antiporter MnhG/PhaG subunit